ncbi:ISLre2 family transposase [Enterococcus hirae]|nr:ISLre2 family transposase [Enterococcus hirae]EMF0534824.1 ISLre2 family transposase [Enterococcus hirae]
MFNELLFEECQQEEILEKFLAEVKKIDLKLSAELQAQGWKYIKTAVRTVVFTFGEVTYSRKCYRKENEYRYPVDEELGVEKYTRFSTELMLQVANLATKIPYREVPDVFFSLKGIIITKDTVTKAIKLAATYYEEREEYRFYEETEEPKEVEKESVDVLYIEGDGIRVKSNSEDKRHIELSHYLIHTGCKEEYHGRNQLMNKFEVISTSNKKAREMVMDYLYNHYDLSKTEIVITNSDMGKGYTPYVFKEFLGAFSGMHIHFWDAYHLKKEISEVLKKYDQSFRERFFEAIEKHDKKEVRLILDTIESMFEDEENEETQRFKRFSRKILREFQYTKSPKHYGLKSKGIGVMESQQSKIANRMKNRGMYWSVRGGETIGKMIIDVKQNTLRELFFGKWREEYRQFKSLDKPRVRQKQGNEEKAATKIAIDRIRNMYNH